MRDPGLHHQCADRSLDRDPQAAVRQPGRRAGMGLHLRRGRASTPTAMSSRPTPGPTPARLPRRPWSVPALTSPCRPPASGTTSCSSGQSPPCDERWGDYLGTAIDPSNPSNVWVSGLYQASSGGFGWGTRDREGLADQLRAAHGDDRVRQGGHRLRRQGQGHRQPNGARHHLPRRLRTDDRL